MKHQEFYNKQLNENNHEINQVGWNDTEKAMKRYIFAKELINKNGKGTIVDVGCGLGTLCDYLPDSKYLGVDIYEPYIEKAIEKYGNKFLCGNVDYIVTNQNIIVDQYVSLGAYTIMDDSISNVEEYVFNELRFMLATARKSVIVNGFHNVVDNQDYKYYHDINKLIKFSQEYSNTHSCSIHIFSKYEFFLEFNFVP